MPSTPPTPRHHCSLSHLDLCEIIHGRHRQPTTRSSAADSTGLSICRTSARSQSSISCFEGGELSTLPVVQPVARRNSSQRCFLGKRQTSCAPQSHPTSSPPTPQPFFEWQSVVCTCDTPALHALKKESHQEYNQWLTASEMHKGHRSVSAEGHVLHINVQVLSRGNVSLF